MFAFVPVKLLIGLFIVAHAGVAIAAAMQRRRLKKADNEEKQKSDRAA